MKHKKYFLLALLFTAFTTSLLAGSNSANRDVIDKNYLEGIKSDNQELKVSSAFSLDEMKS